MTAGVIFDIKRFALHDGPGIRTTVFLKGCPLSCWWCHNPESRSSKPDITYRASMCIRCGACVDACPDNVRSLIDGSVVRDAARCTLCGTCVEMCPSNAAEIIGRELSADELMERIDKDTPFYDQSGGGVTFSGGEPLAQPGFLEEILERCGDREIHRTVDTCGFAPPDTLRAVAEKTDLFLFDLKLMDPDRHLEFTGVGNDLILDNLRMLAGMGLDIQIRIPVIPDVTDSIKNVEMVGEFVASLPHPPPVRLLKHHPTAMEKYARFNIENRLPGKLPAPYEEKMAALAAALTGYELEVTY
jgi:pyruvate formate lyase activating enzyme